MNSKESMDIGMKIAEKHLEACRNIAKLVGSFDEQAVRGSIVWLASEIMMALDAIELKKTKEIEKLEAKYNELKGSMQLDKRFIDQKPPASMIEMVIKTIEGQNWTDIPLTDHDKNLITMAIQVVESVRPSSSGEDI